MKVIVALCLLVTSVAAVDPENLTVGDRVASVAYSYSSQFDPQSNIAPGKSLNQIPANRRRKYPRYHYCYYCSLYSFKMTGVQKKVRFFSLHAILQSNFAHTEDSFRSQISDSRTASYN